MSAIAKRPDAYEHCRPTSVGNGTRFVVSELAGQVDARAQGEGARPRARRPAARRGGRPAEAARARGLPLRGRRRLARAADARARPDGSPTGSRVESFRVITDDRSGIATLTDETGATVTTEATVKVLRRRAARDRDRRGQRPGERARPRAARRAQRHASRRSSACTSPTTRCACSTPQKGTGAVTRVLIDSTDGERTWTTIGVNENIIEASWQALLDSIHFGLLRGRSCTGAQSRPFRRQRYRRGDAY